MQKLKIMVKLQYLNMENEPYTVSTYIDLLNSKLSEISADIVGEISEYKVATSGHIYLTLKDKDTNKILPCMILKREFDFIGIELEVGMEILVKGTPNFYGPFGKLSFIIKHAELIGEGALKKAYDKLKKKLDAEGLFEKSRKRPIPLFVKKIGVITSLHGAVIHDFSNNLKKIGFKIVALDSKVEGPESAKMLTLAMRAFKKEDIDVLVLIRGGGSMQSLAGFDNEALVREIASFPVPVITGIGHHQDIPLATLVSDASESTPSLVAALLNKPWEKAIYSVSKLQDNILHKYESQISESSRITSFAFSKINSFLITILEKHKQIKYILGKALTRVDSQIKSNKNRLLTEKTDIFNRFQKNTKKITTTLLPEIGRKISLLYSRICKNILLKIDRMSELIASNNPERQLKLGYSIISSNGSIVKSVKNLKVGQNLDIKILDGEILSEIKKLK